MRSLPLLMVALSGATLALTWLGYPAWLAWRGGYRVVKVGGTHLAWPSVTIVVVVRNAEATLRQTLHNLLALAYPADRRRILVVSDASTDFTDAVAGSLAHRGVTLLRVMRRRGRAGAEQVARRYVDSDVVVVMDPAARLRVSALAALAQTFADPTVGVAYGREAETLYAEVRGTVREPLYHRFEAWLRDRETRVFGTVSARGSLYAVRGALYRAALPNRPSPDFALTLAAREHGWRAVYVPGAECAVSRPHSLQSDYAHTVGAVTREVLTLRSKAHLLNPLHYGTFAWMLLGHKLGRWLTPWALLAGLLGLLMLAPVEPWARVATVSLGAAALTVVALHWVFIGTPLERALALPGRLVAAAVAVAHACVEAGRQAQEGLTAAGPRPLFASRRHF